MQCMKTKLIMSAYFNRTCVGIFGMNLNKLRSLDLNILLQYSHSLIEETWNRTYRTNLLIKDWLYSAGDNSLHRMTSRLHEYKLYDNGILFVYITDANNMEIYVL